MTCGPGAGISGKRAGVQVEPSDSWGFEHLPAGDVRALHAQANICAIRQQLWGVARLFNGFAMYKANTAYAAHGCKLLAEAPVMRRQYGDNFAVWRRPQQVKGLHAPCVRSGEH